FELSNFRTFELLFRRRSLDRSLRHVVELWKLLLEVRISLRLNASLVWSLAVLGVDLVDGLHARYDDAERSETIPVQTPVVAEIDEYLRLPRVGRVGLGKGHVTAFVALLHRIVGNGRFSPGRLDRRVRGETELH